MKILFLSNLYPPNDIGGYERLAFQVASAMVERGHDVRVLTSDYGGRSHTYRGQQVDRSLRLLADKENIYRPHSVSSDMIAGWNRYNVSELSAALEAEQPDVLFVWNLYFFDRSLLDAISPYADRATYLVTDNWLISFLNPEFLSSFFQNEVFCASAGRRGWLAKIRALVATFVAGRKGHPGRAIFPSRFMAQLHHRAGIQFDDETIIPHGIDLVRHEEGARASRSDLLRGGELRLLFAGRVVSIKGVHTAIQALPRIAGELPGLRVTLDIIGDQRDAPYVEELRAKIQSLGITELVHFRQPVDESELFALFQNYDVYLFPSLYEPFSLTLIHALEAGVPIVASAAGGNGEVVRDGETGLTFPPGDAKALAEQVVRLATDSRLRQSCAEAARRLGESLTFGRMVSAVERYLNAPEATPLDSVGRVSPPARAG